MSTATVVYDPFDHAIQHDPYPTYQRLRDEAPVYWCARRATWVLSRYADVDAALRDPTTFSSARGVFPTRGGSDMNEYLLPMLITTDPPRHTQLRSLVSRGFTPRRMATLESSIRSIAATLIDQATQTDSCDLVTEIAGPLPALVIADMLGVPGEDRDQFHHWSSTLIQSDPDDRDSSRQGMQAAAALYNYLSDFITERRTRPRADLITTLAHAEIDGESLSDDDLLGFSFLLLIAGHETTTNLIANSIVALSEHPATRNALAANRDLLTPAIEELLRFDSPVQGLARTLTREIELHGQTMPAGDSVLLLFGSANRDERAFPSPDQLDIHRHPERQVAFGRGVHFCLGASLARLEARLFFQEFLPRVPEWAVDHSRTTRVRSGPMRGYTSLPIIRSA